ncbi:MAG: GNAT family N-acetyltransferase, partial [Bacillota bacterium]|nr:GNAT family N-acetyltransferase [Bacillota bacterium]
ARQDTPDFLPAAETVSFLAWEELLSEEHLTCSILKKGSMAFCGFCQLQWIFTETPELGIILLPEYQKTRIATEILPPFLAQAKKQLHNKYFYSKIKKNNLPSQKLAEKIGGVFIAVHSLLPKGLPKDLSAFAEAQFPELSYLVYHFMEEDTP